MLASQLKTLYLWWIGWDFYALNQRWVLLEIIPQRETLIPIKAMEDVFTSLYPINDVGNFREIWCEGELEWGPEWLSWEIASLEGSIHFYVRVKAKHRSSVEAALYAHYPDIEIHETQDYTKLVPPTVPNEDWDAYGEDWELKMNEVYPIKTYEKFFEPQGEKISAEEKRIDPIISLLEALTELGPGEYYWVQFTSIPVTLWHDELDYKPKGEKIINKIAKRPEKKISTLGDDLMYIGKQVIGGPEKEGEKYSWPMEEDEETGELRISLTPGEREIITEIDRKISKPAWRTNIRGEYVAKRDSWNGSNRVIMRSYMGHFATSDLNNFGFIPEVRPKVHFFWRKRRGFLRARKQFRMAIDRLPPFYPDRRRGAPILSSEELATIYHFPLRVSGMVVPTMTKIESKKVGPPPNLPVE